MHVLHFLNREQQFMVLKEWVVLGYFLQAAILQFLMNILVGRTWKFSPVRRWLVFKSAELVDGQSISLS